MTKPNNANHKAKCQRYKTSGRREENKKLKQERNERKAERMKQRSANKTQKNTEKNTNRKKKKVEPTLPYTTKLPIQKWTSVMKKLDNYLEEQKKSLKDKSNNQHASFPKRHKHDDIDLNNE